MPSQPVRSVPPRSHAKARRARVRTLSWLYALLGVECFAAFLTTPILVVRRVTVRGTTTLPPAEAQATLTSARIAPGTNLLRVPVQKMEAEIRRHAWVRSVSLRRRLGELEVQITPRQPVLIAQTARGEVELDAEGVVIRPAQGASQARLPRIVLNMSRMARPGSPLDHWTVRASLLAVRADSQPSPARVVKIEVDQNDNLCLNMHDGVKVQLGTPEDMPTKLALLQRIYSREPDIAQRLAAINLSCPSWPACTPRVSQQNVPTRSYRSG
jgi:cell division septal protein FtsQ